MLETWLRESKVRLPATSQLCFCSLVLIDYVLILYDYQMAFSPLCSVVYALGLVRLISRYYDVPQCSTMHPNRCLLLRPCLPCSCLHHAILLVITLFMSRHCAHTVLRQVIGLPSPPIVLVGFLVTSVVSFDMLSILVVLCYSLNLP